MRLVIFGKHVTKQKLQPSRGMAETRVFCVRRRNNGKDKQHACHQSSASIPIFFPGPIISQYLVKISQSQQVSHQPSSSGRGHFRTNAKLMQNKYLSIYKFDGLLGARKGRIHPTWALEDPVFLYSDPSHNVIPGGYVDSAVGPGGFLGKGIQHRCPFWENRWPW